MSIGSGWIWFIPLGPTRTSIGYVCPRQFYLHSGRKPEQIYLWALAQEPLISELAQSASRGGEVSATKDWSFVADRTVGENWFLVGEAAGFADPILAAGMTLTQTAGREAAYSILSADRGEQDPKWLAAKYDHNQRTRLSQHIRYADFWYSANGLFASVIAALQKGPDLVGHILPALKRDAEGAAQSGEMASHLVLHHQLQALELMLTDGWVKGEHDPKRPGIDLSTPIEGDIVQTNIELNERLDT
jgi:flavin-dependent dehydrogenase